MDEHKYSADSGRANDYFEANDAYTKILHIANTELWNGLLSFNSPIEQQKYLQ